MKTFIKGYPIGSIALLLLACIKFEYHSNSYGWSVSVPGLAGGLAVLAIVSIVVIFRILNAVRDICIARGIDASRLRSKYDVLIPIGIVLVTFQARWYGAPMELLDGTHGHQWDFAWSDANWNIPFIGGLVAVVFLLRVLTLVRALADK